MHVDKTEITNKIHIHLTPEEARDLFLALRETRIGSSFSSTALLIALEISEVLK